MELTPMEEMRLSQGREYRAMSMAAQSGNMIVEGYATTFNTPYLLYKDRDYALYELVDRHAFDFCDMTDVIMQYDHRGRVFARTKNNTLIVGADDQGLHIRADLSGTEDGRKLYAEILGGYTDKMSFGFAVEEDSREIVERDGKQICMRTITKIKKLYDVSAVSLPANDMTSISARALADGWIREQMAERRRRQRLKIKMLLEENV